MAPFIREEALEDLRLTFAQIHFKALRTGYILGGGGDGASAVVDAFNSTGKIITDGAMSGLRNAPRIVTGGDAIDLALATAISIPVRSLELRIAWGDAQRRIDRINRKIGSEEVPQAPVLDFTRAEIEAASDAAFEDAEASFITSTGGVSGGGRVTIYLVGQGSGLFNADLLVGRVPGSGWNELIPSATIV